MCCSFFILRVFFCCNFFKFFPCFHVEKSCNYHLCNVHNNKINVLEWLTEPSIMFKFSKTKAKLNSLFTLDICALERMDNKRQSKRNVGTMIKDKEQN